MSKKIVFHKYRILHSQRNIDATYVVESLEPESALQYYLVKYLEGREVDSHEIKLAVVNEDTKQVYKYSVYLTKEIKVTWNITHKEGPDKV